MSKHLFRILTAFAVLLTFFAYSPIGVSSAFAHAGYGDGGGGKGGCHGDDDCGHHRHGGGGPYQAPELDPTTAVQGLILVGGALTLLRSRRKG